MFSSKTWERRRLVFTYSYLTRTCSNGCLVDLSFYLALPTCNAHRRPRTYAADQYRWKFQRRRLVASTIGSESSYPSSEPSLLDSSTSSTSSASQYGSGDASRSPRHTSSGAANRTVRRESYCSSSVRRGSSSGEGGFPRTRPAVPRRRLEEGSRLGLEKPPRIQPTTPRPEKQSPLQFPRHGVSRPRPSPSRDHPASV